MGRRVKPTPIVEKIPLSNISSSLSVWNDTSVCKRGSRITIYTKDGAYIHGKISRTMCSNGDSWICLVDFILTDKNTKTEIKPLSSDYTLLFSISDIKYAIIE